MSNAIRQASGIDLKYEIIALYKTARNRRITARKFFEKFKKISEI